MTNELRQLLRLTLLQLLQAAKHNGVPLVTLSLGVQTRGLRAIGDDVLREEIAYLVDKEFAVLVDQEISPELAPWRITAKGRDYLARN